MRVLLAMDGATGSATVTGIHAHLQGNVGTRDHRPVEPASARSLPPLGGQAFDERRELPVRVIPDNDAAILELLLKLLVQVGGKGVHSMGSRK